MKKDKYNCDIKSSAAYIYVIVGKIIKLVSVLICLGFWLTIVTAAREGET